MTEQELENLLRAQLLAPQRSGFDVGARWRESSWQPRADIYHNDDAIFVQVEAPGLDEKNLRLHYDAPTRQLVIEGVRTRPSCGAPCRCLQMEIEYGAFSRALTLPAEIDAANIAAHLEAGFLIISIPRIKAQQPVAKRIGID